MSKPGRNDLCHCGSGKKYKKCHGPREGDSSVRSRALILTVGGLIAAAIVLGIMQFTGAVGGGSGTRVYDPSHGHYHDEFGREVP